MTRLVINRTVNDVFEVSKEKNTQIKEAGDGMMIYENDKRQKIHIKIEK